PSGFGSFIGDGIAEPALLPSKRRPLVADCPMDFMRIRGGVPVDRAVLVVAEVTRLVRAHGFGSGGLAQKACLTAERCVLLIDSHMTTAPPVAVHKMVPCSNRFCRAPTGLATGISLVRG